MKDFFAKIPHSLIKSREISDSAKLFYCELAVSANFDTGKCWPAGDLITKRNRSKIKLLREELIKHGYISAKEQKGGPFIYHLLSSSNTDTTEQVLSSSNTTCYQVVTPPVTDQSHHLLSSSNTNENQFQNKQQEKFSEGKFGNQRVISEERRAEVIREFLEGKKKKSEVGESL